MIFPSNGSQLNDFSNVLWNLTKRWEMEASETLDLLGYGKNVGAQDLIDRIAYFLEISLGLEALYGDDPKIEQRWLKEPHHLLGNKSPLDHMKEGSMASLVTVVELLRAERGL